MSTSCDLEPYIQKAFQLDASPIFTGRQAPRLYSDQVNRIFVYSGCFNPPHFGHFEVFDAFNHCGKDLNVVAAIVELVSEARLRSKIKSSNPLLLTNQQRARIFNASKPKWCWVYEGLDIDNKLHELKRLTAEDGFTVRYVSLQGVEYLTTLDPATRPTTDDIILVETSGRRAVGDGSGEPYYHPLKPLGLTEDDAHKYAERVLERELEIAESEGERQVPDSSHGLNSANAMAGADKIAKCEKRRNELIDEYLASGKSVKISNAIYTPSREMRLVPCKSTREGVSSTEIRGVLDALIGDDICAAVRDLVPAPEVCAEVLKETTWWQNRRPQRD